LKKISILICLLAMVCTLSSRAYAQETTPPSVVDTLAVDPNGDGTTIQLDWTGYDESLYGDIDYYRIYVQSYEFSDVSGLSVHDTVSSGTFSYRVNNLVEGQTYYFAVVAVDVIGNALTTVTPVSESPQKVTFVSREITQNTT